MARRKIATIVSEKIHPFSLNEKGKAGLAKLEAQYSYDLLLECINIGISRYFKYDVICSGSMMGLNYKDITSNSVGYKTDIMMYSMDFEEFLWAKGYDESFVEMLLSHLIDLRPFNDLEMRRLDSLFLDYVVTGGMPDVVATFINEGNFSNVLPLQRQLLADYEEDIIKYA